MKEIITIILILICTFSKAQFEGTWYTFRIEFISFTSITKDKLITGRIGNYNSLEEYVARVDTLNIKNRILKNDSTLYIITDPEGDYSKENKIHKFVYDTNTKTISTFYFNTIKEFQELQSSTDKSEIKDVERFISEDNSKISYLTYYRKETIDSYLSYPKLIDQPANKIIQLYENLNAIYLALKLKTDEEMFPYFLLGGMSKSVIEVPVYLELKINPLVSREGYDEILIREKFRNNKSVIEALDKFRN